MAETAATRQSMAVITTAEHEGVLREWVGGAARNCTWVIGEENPDFEAILRSLDNQMVSLTLIDDAAMAYRDVSEGDILRFSETWNRNGMGIVFIASPDRTRDDAFLRALPAAGVTAILPTRYFAGRAEGARALLLSMMDSQPSADDIRAALDALPEEKRPIIATRRRKDKEVEDVLASASEKEAPAEEAELMDEAAYFESKMGSAAASVEQPASEGKENAAPEPEPQAPSGIDIAALGAAIGIGTANATPEPQPDAKPPEPAVEEPKPEPERQAEPEPKAVAPEPKARKPRKGRCQKLAVAGVSRKVGCTHLAFSIAFAIKGLQPAARVCCLMSDKREFDAMTSAKGMFPVRDGYRTHKGVAFAYLGKNDPVPDGFDFIVIDCDVVTTRATRVKALFATASRRFVVCGGAPWDISEVGGALSGLHPEEYANWTWCMFGASTEFKVDLVRLLRAQGLDRDSILLFDVPYQTDYLDGNSPIPAAFGQLFQMKSKRKKAGAAKAQGIDIDDGEKQEGEEAR